MKHGLPALAFLIVSYLGNAQSIDPASVTIVRDTFGVPHIFGETDASTAFGLAYAHAEDDFNNIQRAVLAGKGILGEVEGKDGALFDFGLHFLKIDSLVDARYNLDLSMEYRKVLDGYAQGLNAFAAQHPKEILHRRLFPIHPQELVKSYTLSLSLMAGLGMALKAVNENRIDEFFGANEFSSGSNALAVAPEKMADGRSYLLVNSHQPIEGRFSWYEAHVQSKEGWNCVGGLFAGGATIFVGSNRNLGWAHTFNYHQFGDVYKLQINPKNRKQYLYDGQWRDFQVRTIRFKVKVAGIRIPIRRKVKWSVYGPVYKSRYGTFAFRFPSYEDIRAGEQWFWMNKAKNLDEFSAAMSMQAVPLFNTVYADKDGNILLHSGGKVPKRNPELDWTPPITSDSSGYLWTQILGYDRLPHVENPECGFVYNANNTPLHCTGDSCNWSDHFPGIQTFEYNRGERFGHLMKKHVGPFSEADLDRIKYDNAFHPNGAYETHFKALFELDTGKYPDIKEAIHKLKRWNRQGNAENMDAALAMVVHDHLRLELDGPFALLMIREQGVKEEMAVAAVRKAQKLLRRAYGTLDVPLGTVQRLIRGEKSLPAHGLREVPRATDTKLHDRRKGIYKVTGGDGYIQIARFSTEGAEIRSVNAYGASNRPESPHYNDQMEMFTRHEYKPMPLDRKTIEASAERIYHPGIP